MKYKLVFFLMIFCVRGMAQQPVDVLHYHYELELSDKTDAITGKAVIEVRFTDAAALLKLDLASLEEEKGMVAFSVMEGGNLLRTSHSNDVLTIFLNKPAERGAIKTFTIQYMGVPKDGLIISKNKYGERRFFADNRPNRAHHWIPCIDRPDDKASFEFIVSAPAAYQVISNGIKISESNLDNGMKRTQWREEIPQPTKVMVIGVARFAVKVFEDSPPQVPVSAWVYPQDSAKGFFDYALAPSIVKFFSSYIAPFPYKKLANVQSKTMFGGMENAAAIFYPEGSVTGTRKIESTMAHEIAHQWFGDMASEKSFAHLWLSEGFASYFTDLYMEHTYGVDSARKRLVNERSEVIDFARTSTHAVVDSSSDLMSLLNANSYQKGAWVLHMLRQEVGDTVFRKIIQSYYQQYKGANADTRDFEKQAETVSGKELTWFFEQWLYRPGVPEIAVKWKADGKQVKIELKQLQEQIYQLPLELTIILKDGKQQTQKIFLKEKEASIKMDLSGEPVQVIADPDIKLLADIRVSKQ